MAVMPKDWTPRMYLGALLTSIQRNSVILLEPVMLTGRRYMTANEIHWIFIAYASEIEKRLAMSGAYLRIAEGKFRTEIKSIDNYHLGTVSFTYLYISRPLELV